MVKLPSTLASRVPVPNRAIVLALLTLGCSAAKRSPDRVTSEAPVLPTPQPSVSQPAGPELSVELELVREPELAVHVAIACTGAADGATTLRLGEGWGGVRNPARAIEELRVRTADGVDLTATSEPESRWAIQHEPGARLLVEYTLAANDVQKSPDHSDHYRPILNPSLFHTIGETGILIPTHLDDSETRKVHFHWKGFAEAGWTVATSFGVDPRGFELSLPVPRFRHAVFMAGDVAVHRRDIHGQPLFVAIANRGFSFDHARLVDLAARVVTAEREFFDDFDYPFYLITAIPVGTPNPSSLSLGGTGLTQSFATFLQAETDFGPDAPGYTGLRHLLAHEMFHQWNGLVLTLAPPEQLVYWFSEGFTDFYARRMLLRAGLIDGATYASGLSRDLADYYKSPVLNAPNSRIAAEFWTDRDISKLPYRRGDVVAMLIDRELKAHSGGTFTLDDWMRELVRKARSGAPPVDTRSLLSDIAARTDDAFAAKLSRILEDGETAELASDMFQPCVALRWEEEQGFDLGFDFDASMREHRVIAVREDSPAYAAGLRDGQTLDSWSVYHGQPSREVTLQVLDQGESRAIRYLPQGPTVSVPRAEWLGAGEESGVCAGI